MFTNDRKELMGSYSAYTLKNTIPEPCVDVKITNIY